MCILAVVDKRTYLSLCRYTYIILLPYHVPLTVISLVVNTYALHILLPIPCTIHRHLGFSKPLRFPYSGIPTGVCPSRYWPISTTPLILLLPHTLHVTHPPLPRISSVAPTSLPTSANYHYPISLHAAFS